MLEGSQDSDLARRTERSLVVSDGAPATLALWGANDAQRTRQAEQLRIRSTFMSGATF